MHDASSCDCSCHDLAPCSCGCGQMGNCQVGDLLDMTFAAKHWLLKDKIKQRLESQMGKRLDEIADMAVEMLTNKMEMKRQKAQRHEEIMAKLKG